MRRMQTYKIGQAEEFGPDVKSGLTPVFVQLVGLKIFKWLEKENQKKKSVLRYMIIT